MPEIHSTSEVALNGVKILVYGAAGAGKTKLISTLPNPFILSAESGLLSLAKYKLPYMIIESIQDLEEAHDWCLTEEADGYDIVLDSVSEIGETVLSFEKKRNKDPRAAYGEMQTQVADLIRAFRDLQGKNVYMTAKLEKSQDEMGRILYAPSMPGNKAGQALPYFFDEVFAIRVEKNAETKELERYLQTNTDGLWQAKDRSDMLDMWEPMDLGAIIEKIATVAQEAKKISKTPAAKKPASKAKAKTTKSKAKAKPVDWEEDEAEDD